MTKQDLTFPCRGWEEGFEPRKNSQEVSCEKKRRKEAERERERETSVRGPLMPSRTRETNKTKARRASNVHVPIVICSRLRVYEDRYLRHKGLKYCRNSGKQKRRPKYEGHAINPRSPRLTWSPFQNDGRFCFGTLSKRGGPFFWGPSFRVATKGPPQLMGSFCPQGSWVVGRATIPPTTDPVPVAEGRGKGFRFWGLGPLNPINHPKARSPQHPCLVLVMWPLPLSKLSFECRCA